MFKLFWIVMFLLFVTWFCGFCLGFGFGVVAGY